MQKCSVKHCQEMVLGVPNKSKPSILRRTFYGGWSMAYPTKEKGDGLCYFHSKWPNGIQKRIKKNQWTAKMKGVIK